MLANLSRRFWPSQGGSMFLWPNGDLGTADVTPTNADTLPPVARALELVSGDIGRLPACVQVETSAGYEKIDSPALDLIKHHPNEYQSGYEFMRYMVRTLMLQGNAGAVIRRTRGGELLELVPVLPDRFRIQYRTDGSVYYRVADIPEDLEPDRVIHFRLSGTAPLWGDSPVVRGRATLDLLAEQEATGRAHFSTGAVGKIALTSPELIGDSAVARLRESWKASHGNAGAISTPMIMQGGMTASTVGANLSQSDWLKARNFSTQQVGMMFGIPPQMLYADETGETAEHTYTQLRAYVDSCLSHYTELIGGEIQRKLLPPGERMTFDFRHMLRGSVDQVVAAARQAIDAGVMTQNEAREMLNLPRIEGGDELVFSKNYSAGGLTDAEQDEDATDEA